MRFLPRFLALAALAFPLEASAVEFIGHRGASHDAPENTLAAFKLGFEQKADGVELDIYLTKDGRIAVIHDKTTKRTAGVDRPVAEQTMDELRALDAGSWKGEQWKGERVPELSEVLAIIPAGRQLFVEIKCGPEVLPELERVLRGAGEKARGVALIGFNYDTMKQAKARLPEFPAYWIVASSKEKKTGASPVLDELLQKAVEAGFDGLDLHYGFPIDQAFVARVKAAQKRLYVWTCDEPQAARRLVAAGIDGITTDRPGWLREQLATPAGER